MKKILTAFAMALLLVGCAREYDDTDLKNRVTTLETKVGNLEAQMKAIFSASGDGVFVLKVEELKEDDKIVGITVTYSNLQVVTFKISGAGSEESNLSVIKNADGVYCWAINGEIIQVDGKDLTVSTLPSFEIKDGHLYMTADGKTTDIGEIGGSLGDAIFSDIQVTDNAVVLTMQDGSTIEIPFAKAFRLVIAKTAYAVTTTDPIEIPYTVENKTQNTVVDVFTDANFTSEVDEEKIVITPLVVAKGSALAYADSQVGLTSIVKLNFGEEGEEDLFQITDESIDYVAEAADATVEVHAVSNIDFEVKPQVDWISLVETRATNYTIVLKVEDNPDTEIRTGAVQIVRAGTEEVLQTVNIAQKAKEEEVYPYTPDGWDKVLDISNYKVNSTFQWDAIQLNPSAVTLQYKFYSKKWNNHKFQDRDENNNQLYSNRLGEFANASESSSVLLRFSNDGDADGQLCLNAGILGLSQAQVRKDNEPYVWPTGEWVVLSLVSDGTTLAIYHDTRLIQSWNVTPSASVWDLERFDISMTWDDGSNWPLAQAFNGYLAFARVWSRALSVEDIAATLCQVPEGKDENLEINWEFNGEEEIYVANSAPRNEQAALDFTECWDGNGNKKDNSDAARAGWTSLEDASLGDLCYTHEAPEPVTPTPGENVKAIYWGNTQAAAWYKEFNRAIDLPDGYSVTIHFYYDAARAQRLGNFGDKNESPCNMLRFGEAGNNNQLEWMVDTGAGRIKIRASVEAVPAQWNAVTLTAGADGYKMYINGEAAGEDASSYRSGTSFQAFEFANSWGTAYRSSFEGAMAYISVWSKQLSADEVAANVFTVPSGSGLEAFWPMTEGEGFVFTDATGKYDDIDLHYCTRCDDEVNYVDVDVTEYVEWREYPAIEK